MGILYQFQSTRLSRASTITFGDSTDYVLISIHKALASLDFLIKVGHINAKISIHKALASLDNKGAALETAEREISIHKALASLDMYGNFKYQIQGKISIHKALASLDGQTAMMCFT